MIGIQRKFRVRYGLVSLFMVLWYYCSPWTIVIQERTDTPISRPNPEKQISLSDPKESSMVIQKQGIAKDSIDQKFGSAEEEFLKQVGKPSTPPKLSRDESIELIYNINSPLDWLNLIDGQDSHGLLTLTKLTQRYIYNKQNPTKCAGQKFLILKKLAGDDAFGMGAIVQHISDYLSVAIQTNSILLYATDLSPGEHFISEPIEGGASSCGRSFDCIFQRLSNCTNKYQKGMDTKDQSIFVGEDVDLDVDAYLAKHKSPIPPLFENALRMIQPDITGEMLKYWWRAQASAYIMRFNDHTSRRLKDFRLGKDVKQAGIQWDVNGDPKEVDVPFPMPEGTISIHVRHGDKGSEMRLVPFNDYVVRAEKFSAENPLGTWKRAFLSTEDPNVIEQMRTMARITPFSYSSSNSRWTWYWSDIPRLNTGPETQLKEFGNRTDLTIKWILQLVMAVECDVFVGTRGSGWNRLIDSLRCVWLASCKQPFLEVGFENDWAGYGP